MQYPQTTRKVLHTRPVINIAKASCQIFFFLLVRGWFQTQATLQVTYDDSYGSSAQHLHVLQTEHSSQWGVESRDHSPPSAAWRLLVAEHADTLVTAALSPQPRQRLACCLAPNQAGEREKGAPWDRERQCGDIWTIGVSLTWCTATTSHFSASSMLHQVGPCSLLVQLWGRRAVVAVANGCWQRAASCARDWPSLPRHWYKCEEGWRLPTTTRARVVRDLVETVSGVSA